MGLSTLSQKTVRTFKRTGGNPAAVSRAAVHHVSTHLHRHRLRNSYGRLVCVDRPSRLRIPRVVLDPADRWPQELTPALEALRRDSQAALDHMADLLGSGPTRLGRDIDWHRDFKSGFRWPEAFYQDVVVTRLDDDSDAKVPWELSRSHHLLALGRAAAVFEDEAPAAELESQLRSWIVANPPGIGINWTNAMEVAIRAANWVWAIGAVENLRPLDPHLRAQVAHSLAAHARHIWHNLEGSPDLRSNHYLSDIVGLLVVAAVLPEDPMAGRWSRYAQRSLEREAQAEILPDGLDFEASLSYHGLVLELMLVASWSARESGRPLSRNFDDVVRKMLTASLALRHPGGRMPQFGDSDSGRILPGSSSRPPSHDHLLWLGTALLGTEPPPHDAPHAEVALTFGLPAWRRAAERGSRVSVENTPTRSFPDGGLHVLRADRAHLVVRCGDVGQNGNGGHSHNDLLSFELSVDRALLVADPGTYVYTSDPHARNIFRSTAAHSTVIVGGEEINPFDPRQLFRLPRFARPLPSEVGVCDGQLRLVCAHDGYRRLEPSVIVRRTFVLDQVTDALSVSDEVIGEGSHRATSHIQFASGCSVEPAGPGVFALRVGSTRHLIEVFGEDAATVEAGCVSGQFGRRGTAPRLRIDAFLASGGTFGYRISRAETGA